MAGAFASVALESGMRALCSLLPGSAGGPRAATREDAEELRRLQRTMRRIHAALEDADFRLAARGAGAAAARLRLRELKAVAYDAEDVVGEWEYEVARRRAEAVEPERAGSSGRHSKRTRREVNGDCFSDIAMTSLHDLAVRAREIRERFNEIIREHEDLHLSHNDGEKQIDLARCSLQRETSSTIHEPSIRGRELDKNNVIEAMLSEGKPMSVLAIVGMGGLGKTTLAQLVFNDPRLHQSFDKLAWIYVSEQFDVKTITRNIISSLQKQKCDLVNMNDLQGALVEQLEGKKLLLVLDDVWNEHRAPWDSMCAPLMAAKLCKIIVTTRSETVARLVQTMPLYPLDCLTQGDSWALFEQIAFVGQDPAGRADFTKIGEGIVERCKGLPLAIRTLGSMLRYETNAERWKEVLESDLWDLAQQQNDILPALELSYKHMPVFLKRCFVALSLFPKDYHFSQDKVICLWKSLGLLHASSLGDNDKIGRLYFSDLIKRSIIQSNQNAYTMHDLTHDLACCVAGEEFLRLENDIPVEVSCDVRYISIFLPWTGTVSKLHHLHGSNALRAVILSYKDGAGGAVEIPEELFVNSKQLCTVILDGVSLTKASLPDSMGNLKQLRHLVLRDTGGLSLPISICHLFSLQNIDVTTSCNMKPACLPNGIGCLINLHTLPVITIKRGAWHCHLRELKELENLSGKLCIKGLDNVCSVDEAEEANLCRKHHLQALHLTFPDGDWDHCEHGQESVTTSYSRGNTRRLVTTSQHQRIFSRSLQIS